MGSRFQLSRRREGTERGADSPYRAGALSIVSTGGKTPVRCDACEDGTCRCLGGPCDEQSTHVVSDAAVLVGGYDVDADGAALLRDGGGVALVGFRVDGQPEEGELAAYLFADAGGVLADAAGEDERVEAAEDCRVARDSLGDGAAEDGNGLLCCCGALICRGGELAQVGNTPRGRAIRLRSLGQACQAGVVVEQGLQLLEFTQTSVIAVA